MSTPSTDSLDAIRAALEGIVQRQSVAETNIAAARATAIVTERNSARDRLSLTPFDSVTINPESDQGRRLYALAVQPLATKFDGRTENLLTFIQGVSNKVKSCNWTSVCNVSGRDILSEYGRLTVDQVKSARDARSYNVTTANPITDGNYRERIDAAWMFEFL